MGVECSEACMRKESGSRSWERMGECRELISFLYFRDLAWVLRLVVSKGYLSWFTTRINQPWHSHLISNHINRAVPHNEVTRQCRAVIWLALAMGWKHSRVPSVDDHLSAVRIQPQTRIWINTTSDGLSSTARSYQIECNITWKIEICSGLLKGYCKFAIYLELHIK